MNNSATELQEIYRRQVLEHSKQPHNCHRPSHVDREALGFNPLCGDKLSVFLSMDGDTIREASFEGTGCAISVASASMMTDALCGQPESEARNFISAVLTMLADGKPPEHASLADIQALSGVRNYPSRIKCAALAWTTAEAALDGGSTTVSTEY